MARKTIGRDIAGLATVLVACMTAQAQAPVPPRPDGEAVSKSPISADGPARAVSQLVEQLERHPARPSTVRDRTGGLFLLDIAKGRATPIADEPDPGVAYCGSPAWSSDGRRILFDAMTADQVALSHIKMIEVVEGRLTVKDLGIGNCPTFSPDDRRIAFLFNPGPQAGVWVMLPDGSQRETLGSYGRPRWSPYGYQMMMTSFSSPCSVTIMDANPEKSGRLQVPGTRIYSVPTWADDRTLVAVIGSEDTIALIDTSIPAAGRIKEVLWKKGKGFDVTPAYPSYSPSRREYVFVGEGPKGMAMYSFRKGQTEPPRRLEPDRFDKLLRDPTFSPDGRYLLFTSDRRLATRSRAPPGPSLVELRRRPDLRQMNAFSALAENVNQEKPRDDPPLPAALAVADRLRDRPCRRPSGQPGGERPPDPAQGDRVLKDADRAALRAGVDELGQQIDSLRESLRTKARPAPPAARRAGLSQGRPRGARARRVLPGPGDRGGEGPVEAGPGASRPAPRGTCPLGHGHRARSCAATSRRSTARSSRTAWSCRHPTGRTRRTDSGWMSGATGAARPSARSISSTTGRGIAGEFTPRECVRAAPLRAILQRQQVRRRDRPLRGARGHQEPLPDRRGPARDAGLLDGRRRLLAVRRALSRACGPPPRRAPASPRPPTSSRSSRRSRSSRPGMRRSSGTSTTAPTTP